MVNTRSQTAKDAKKQQKKDVQNTKRSKGGQDNDDNDNDNIFDNIFVDDKTNDGNNLDQVKFREFLAHVFPSQFANDQVKAAKNERKRRSGKSIVSKKQKKVQKVNDDSDASSSASYEDDGNSTDGSVSDDCNCNFTMPDGRKGKVFAFKSVNGKLKPVKNDSNNTPLNVMMQNIFNQKTKISNPPFAKGRKNRVIESEESDEDTSSDYCPDDDVEYEDEDVSTIEDEDEDELEYEEETFDEMFDKNPEEESDYEDDNDDEKPQPTVKSKKESDTNGQQKKTDIPQLELSIVEKELQNKYADVPKDFQKKCHNIWVEFKEKLENERKLYIAKGKKEEKKARRSNLTSFRKMLREGDVMNDLRYFNRFMSVDEQQTALEEMKRVKEFSRVDKPYRLRLLDAPIPPQIKAVALKKINALRYTSPGDGEYNKLKKWVDAFLQLPFGKHSQLNLSLLDGQDKCHEFMDNARNILDEAVYGLDDVKLQVIQMLGQWISNPNAVGSAVAIHGPMGTGKTTLVKEGISKILGREFIFIALGGATDSSFLEGHSYTYECSTWCKIVDLLMQCQTMNPIIYFDELDKVSDTPRGEEIIGILTHLTDTSQNDKFHDKYFSEIEFDLSKCMFFFSYNDPERVNPILRDRMYTIKTNGYSSTEKVTIAEKHLIPKLLPQVGFSPTEITFPRDTLEYITREYTSEDEKGVRSLKRRLEIIFTKLNLYRLLKPGTTMFGQKIPDIVSFPMNITPELVQELLRKEKKDNNHWVMYT
jgi:ATP-dependent Lon protease